MRKGNNRKTACAEGKKALSRVLVIMAILLVTASCSSTGTKPMRPQSTGKTIKTASESAADYAPIIESAARPSPGVTQKEIYEGTGVFINEAAARSRPDVVSEDGEIVLNFEAESIQSVVHTILGEVLQETFVIAPGVSGEVTFSTSRPVTREQLIPILELLLGWNGATMVFTEGRYHILPVAEAIAGHLVPEMGSVDQARGYEVRAVPLRYIASTEMAKILQPYARESAIVQVDPLRNMLFLGGTREELRNYLRTVEIFDVDWLEGMSVGIFPLNTVDVNSIIAELEGVFGSNAEGPLAGSPMRLMEMR